MGTAINNIQALAGVRKYLNTLGEQADYRTLNVHKFINNELFYIVNVKDGRVFAVSQGSNEIFLLPSEVTLEKALTAVEKLQIKPVYKITV